MSSQFSQANKKNSSETIVAFLGPFTSQYGPLVNLLVAIDQATNSALFASATNAVASVLIPPSPQPQVKASKVKKRAPVSTAAGKAYGDGYTKAKDVLKPVVDKLSPDQVNFMAGLGFTAPNDDAKKRTDILNSVMSAWDAPAAHYMKGETGAGDKGKSALYDRLQEFDTALETQGKTPVSADK